MGNNAYVCGPNVIVPGDDDDFNYEKSMMRMNIERAFGELVRRWGILWRPLEMKFERRAPIIEVCMRLYNFCIDERLEVLAHTETWNPYGRSPGGICRASRMDRDGCPVEHLQANFTCGLGRGPPREFRVEKDTGLRENLEIDCRDAGLRRSNHIK